MLKQLFLLTSLVVLIFSMGGSAWAVNIPKLKQEANAGNASAEFYLYFLYDTGDGVIKNDAIATYWLKKAAEQGYETAEYDLGISYATGDGVAKNNAKYIYWVKKAAEQGSIVAKDTLCSTNGQLRVKKIIIGHVGPGFYTNVCIISNSVGVKAYGPTTITNSVIVSPICVKSNGYGLFLKNNRLKCGLGVKFYGHSLVNNSLIDNIFNGTLTNRPDVFGGN